MKVLIQSLTFYKDFLIEAEALKEKIDQLKLDLENLGEPQTFEYDLANRLLHKLEKRMEILKDNAHHFRIRTISFKKMEKLFNKRYA